MNKLKFSIFATTVILGCLSGSALAESYPSKPISIIVGYSAGGGTDIMARTIAPYLEHYLGDNATVVVRNKPGAGGQIGFTAVAHSKPDGYTLGTMNIPTAIALMFSRNADYDLNSFTWLGNFVFDPSTLVVAKNSPFKSVSDIIEAAKKKPGSITVGIAGLGGNDYFAATDFASAAGIKLTIIPFKGASKARSSLLGQHVDLGTMAYSQTTGFKNLRVLAVFSDHRLSYAPNIPTGKELGLDVLMGSFRGIVAPAGLPDNIRKALTKAIEKVANNKAFEKSMSKQGSPITFSATEKYRELAAKNKKKLGKMWEENPWR